MKQPKETEDQTWSRCIDHFLREDADHINELGFIEVAKMYHSERLAASLPSEEEIDNSREFKVEKLTNGMGHKHLVVITEPAIEDISIGTVVIVPYAEGFKDPIKVVLQTDKNGIPKRANEQFAMVLKYIYG